MHPTADTLPLKFLQRRGAAGDAGRSVAFSSTRTKKQEIRNEKNSGAGVAVDGYRITHGF
jgi:hypothetical protein